MLAITVTIPRLPRTKQRLAEANSTIRRDMPPLSIKPPASINNGTAMMGHESRAVNMR